jgi:hypothetical protein
MASTDAKAIPVKNAALRITFPILDADGDLVSGASGLDSEVDKDTGGFNDCTNEATEIGSSGMYYLDLTSTEMNADTVTVIVKTSTVGAKTTPIVIYTAARNVNDLAFPTVSGRSLDVTTTGGAGIDWANVENPTTTLNLSGTTVKTATDIATLIAALNNISTADVLTQVNAALDAVLADSIPADGSRPSLRQATYMVGQWLFERSVSGTTVTVKKVDGSTTLFTLTLNDATTPTSITRAT